MKKAGKRKAEVEEEDEDMPVGRKKRSGASGAEKKGKQKQTAEETAEDEEVEEDGEEGVAGPSRKKRSTQGQSRPKRGGR